jgi:hypothetical protein
MLFQAYLSNDGLVEAVFVHHRRRRALTLTAELTKSRHFSIAS